MLHARLKAPNCCLPLFALCIAAAPPLVPDTPRILGAPVNSFVRENTGLANIAIGAASELSVPMGFEGIAEDPERDATVSVRNTNVAGLLDALIRADPRYMWSLADNRIVDIYPRNPNQRFLDATVARFTIENKTRAAALDELIQTATFQHLLTNLRARIHTPVSGPPNLRDLGPKINIDLKDASLRTILNTLVLNSGGSAWSAVRYGNHLQYLSLGIGG